MIISAITSSRSVTSNAKRTLRISIACTLAMAAMQNAAVAAESTNDFFQATKPIVDIRLRQETVEQTGLPEDADALTLRARLGFETGKVLQTSLLAEGEAVTALNDDYNDTIASHGNATFPVVADPESTAVNRLQLVNSSIPKTTLTLGRQRVNLDDQRFVGNSGWRQKEQTLDAFRFVNKGVKDLTLDFTFLNRVNRVFGEDSPQGEYKGDGYLANIGYQTPIGKITGFGYLLKFDALTGVPAALSDSTATYGLRFSGEQPAGAIKINYAASYAQQSDYGDNPGTFDNNYYLAELGMSYKVFSTLVGMEVLEGDGVKGFTTPLATLHKFQGWADKFLNTPANGIEDTYLNVGLSFKKVGALDMIGLAAIYHDYASNQGSIDYGSEINLQLQAKWNRFSAMLKYADYSADAFATDTKKMWAQIEFVW